MANLIKLKRSAVEGAVPTIAQLDLGELAINTYDGKLYLKRNDGLQDYIVEVGSNVGFEVKNQTGSTIPKGTVVKFAGTLGASGKLLVAPFIANNTDPSEYVMGITENAIVNGGDGFVIEHGKVFGLNTSAFSQGAILYASATVSGGLTDVRPAAPNNKVIVAAVIHSATSAGILEIRLTPGSNIGNDELVELGTLTDGDTLIWNAAAGRFENEPVVVDPNTTYSITAETVTGGANLRLTGSDISTDDVKIASGTNITVSRTDANTITVTADDQVAAHVAAADPHSQYTTLTDIAAVTGDVHGVVDRAASTLSFVDATRTFSITPVSGSWTFYHKGELKTVTGAKSIQIANTAGARFIRIDPTTLNLVEGGAVPDFVNDTIVAYIYYSTTGAKALIVGDERHGVNRDTTWHSNQHLNVGTVWRSGGALGYTLSSQTAIQLDVGTPLLIADEDLLHTITHSATPSADFQQILTTAASLEVLYLSGTTYTSTTQSTTPWVAGTSRARYNLVSGGSGSLVDASEGHYVTYWLIATNDIRRPVKLVMGRASHATIDAAYAEEFQEYGISFAEQVFMYQIVLQTSTAYTSNTPRVVIAAVRKVTSKLAAIASTATAESHGTLTGRDAADAHTIGSITGLQTALDGKQVTLVSGTNIKTINGTTLLGSGDIAVSGGSSNLNDLTDVVIGGTALATGDVLRYNGTNWINDTYVQTILSPVSRQTTQTLKPISVGTTAPGSAAIGDLWVDTN